ncbi:hypothetical protein BGZ61DRAFT_462631 [Ilyonectria robusta]|uniref:uncharacterized protein n=1 Tax=Ilyonectria robusta TaxID=1079257 RepID=UPI001E8E300C|nr:uncharacterized protein BGZ61DRAFT_462631 [Ilyonectria robusta]KAH8663817.1 hypothetical protein BGZ61DRAFT_462631 [Ilyonectria robusta]
MHQIPGDTQHGKSECLYAIKKTPNGHGLFALEGIQAGTLIIQEEPLLTISREETRSRQEYMCVMSKVGRLQGEAQSRLIRLYHNPKKLQEFAFLEGRMCPGTNLDCALVLAKFYTNAATISSGKLQVGLYPTFCRMNHACTPNTSWMADDVTGTMEVYAVRDIMEGEEITDSYTDVARSRESRGKELRNWGFECECSVCDGPEAAEHDIRRRRVAQIRGILELYEETGGDEKPIFAEVPKSDLEALKLAEESLALLSTEELVEDLGIAHGLCAKFARAAGLNDVADDHEEREFEILVRTTGECIE